MEPYKTFLVPFDFTKLKLFMRNDTLKNKEKTYQVMMKNNLRIHNHQVIIEKSKEKVVAPIYGNNYYLNNISIHKSQPMHTI